MVSTVINNEYGLLKFKMKHTGKIIVTVSGISMFPVLQEGDKVSVVSTVDYNNGDILSFLFEGSVIVHRLLLHRKDHYYLKGDNSFRIEEVYYNNILGKVVEIEREGCIFTPPFVNEDFIRESIEIYSEFVKFDFNHEVFMKTKKYLDFKNKYLCDVRSNETLANNGVQINEKH